MGSGYDALMEFGLRGVRPRDSQGEMGWGYCNCKVASAWMVMVLLVLEFGGERCQDKDGRCVGLVTRK